MGSDPGHQLVLLRFSGDVGTKARSTRHHFVRRLLHNLRDAVESLGASPRLTLSHDRILAELPEAADAGTLARVFGVQSISRVLRTVPADLDAIERAGSELYRERVRGRRFAVRVRRVGSRDRIPVAARDVERRLGAALLPASAGVDLGHPEQTVHIEIEGDRAFLLDERIPAHGGLPLGVEGRAVALVSGGFDSAVAAWLLLKRGVHQDFVFCNLGGASHRVGALRVVKVLADRWCYGDRPQLFAIDFEAVVRELEAKTERRYWQVLLKRLMLRAADAVARERRASALVTGEAVGQVSSQTLRNLAVISRATDRAILRPLVGFNKEEIIEIAQRIGTFELSKVVREYCNLVPRRPATAAALAAIEEQEARLDPALVERVVAGRAVFDLRGLDVEKLDIPELEIERIPEDAVVIDLRPERAFRDWHHPEAVRLDFAHAREAWPSFDRGKTFVLYCDLGLMSAHLAELMRREGFDAFHVKGGTRALRHRLEESAR
jgi:thiamine biosynthesis protein ThiI